LCGGSVRDWIVKLDHDLAAPQHAAQASAQQSAQFSPQASQNPPSQQLLQSSPQQSAQLLPQHIIAQHPSPELIAPGETVERLEHPAARASTARASMENMNFMEITPVGDFVDGAERVSAPDLNDKTNRSTGSNQFRQTSSQA
jgi:hypothetical protein